MLRPIATASLGVALCLAAATFDSASFYVPGVALVALAVLATGWVVLAATGAAIERSLGTQLTRVDPRQLIDGASEERDLLIDDVATAGSQIPVVVVDAEVRCVLRVQRELVPEPSVDGAVEARVDIGNGLGHGSVPQGACRRGRHRS